MMNVFRLAGDLSHVLAIVILIANVWRTKSCAGVSGKSQLLYTIVFTTRYLDLFLRFISFYNTFLKILFITSSYGTLYLIYVKFKKTYDRTNDILKIEFLYIPAAILALIFHYSSDVFEVLWAFSIYLEAVAILPQLFMIWKTEDAESFTYHYLFALGTYRAMYILNWIYRYYAENHYDPISIIAGIIQTALYCDFFYLYVQTRFQDKFIDVETVKTLPEKLETQHV